MGNHDNGLVELLAGPLQKGDDLLAGFGIQVAGGLVGQDNGRFGSQGPGDGHPLLLPPGQLVGHAVQFFLQAKQGDDFFQEPFVGTFPVQLHGQNNVFIGTENRDQIIILKNKTNSLPAEDGEVFIL